MKRMWMTMGSLERLAMIRRTTNTTHAWCAFYVLLSACQVSPYCLNCSSGSGDASLDGHTDVFMFETGRADACSDNVETCNGMDDNCNGTIDEGTLPTVGEVCGTDEGLCTLGRWACESGALRCAGGAVLAAAETCNGDDDDCDTRVDEGDPGGGARCGRDPQGECRGGLTVCRNGAIACDGEINPLAETCDGRDNDCDGTIDDGNPGGGEICAQGMDACTSSIRRCQGGMLTCIIQSTPQRETCDQVDNDCDTRTDEDFVLATDVNHCGNCSTACTADFARSTCTAGVCAIASCESGHFDIDHNFANGCEYACELRGSDVCNGRDDDCDMRTDESLTPPDICFRGGECAGTVATCAGTRGWRCPYPSTVSLNAMGDIIPETDCDDRDNDCNSVVDDSFRNRNATCSRGLGVCSTRGNLVCNSAHDALVCNAVDPGAGSTEICNGLDDDCNGMLDDSVADEWVTVSGSFGSVQMYRYEATRPDSTVTNQGTLTHRPCSMAGRQPWTNVRYPEAQAACAAVGARLCSETEWQRACQTTTSPACSWSTASTCTTYQANACNGNDFDSDTLRPGDQDALAATGAFAACYADWGGSNRIFDLSGANFSKCCMNWWTRAIPWWSSNTI